MPRIGVALTAVLLASLAHAEGVGAREQWPSTPARLRGATTVMALPTGLVTLGGSSLRVLARSGRRWEVLHRVPGDNLYRVAGDEAGRVLAAWEAEPHVHLFAPATGQHAVLPKPSCQAADIRSCHLDELFFAPSGREAIVFMAGTTGGSLRATVAYRVALEGRTPPVLLFRQDGHRLHASARGGVFVVPKDRRTSCDHGGCAPIAAVVAQEITDQGATLRTLLGGEGDRYTVARPVFGDGRDEGRVAVTVGMSPGAPGLLRWRFGDRVGDFRSFPRPLPLEAVLRQVGDELLDLRPQPGGALAIHRLGADGEERLTTLPPLPHRDPDVAPDFAVYGVGGRRDGGLWVHWGNHLVLVPPVGAPRRYDLEPLLRRRNEWAGADVYVASPEVLWVGVEVGAGRDFVAVDLAAVERQARPWAAP